MKLDLPENEAVIEEVSYKLRAKPVTTARKAPNEQQTRDLFMTPNYAIDLLIPFIPKEIKVLWEPAYGTGKISRKLRDAGYTVFESDIKDSDPKKVHNFITDPMKNLPENISIITNPPFSVKDLFIERCFEYEVPFAMLINMDYSQQTIDWIRRGMEKIIPTARIAYITPNILKRIHDGEVWKLVDDKKECSTLQEYMESYMPIWITDLYVHHDVHNYATVDETPMELLYKYSNAQFHSGWLTYGFGLNRTETFVDLPIEQRRYNI